MFFISTKTELLFTVNLSVRRIIKPASHFHDFLARRWYRSRVVQIQIREVAQNGTTPDCEFLSFNVIILVINFFV